jgi:DNA replication and repair protein RecF
MYIKEINLKDFRNYENLQVQFHNKVNIFLGHNAQGKTNLLESIYIISMGKSFRTGKDREMVRFGSEFFRVKATAVKEEELVVEIAVTKEGKKGVKIDGLKAKKMSELLENVYIVVFSPEDLRIVKDEPEKRRKFIDRELCQIKPSYYSNLNHYKKVLAQRNAYLKEYNVDDNILDIWDMQLAEYGSKIIEARTDFIKKLNVISGIIHKDITNRKEELEVIYEPDIEFSKNLKEIFFMKMKLNRKNDIRRRTTTIGPHKDDLKLLSNGIDIRNFGSQGQQRTAALSLKLSEIKLIEEETGENPVLLLDDVLSELDRERQNYLINSLSDIQVFITTTEISEEVEKCLGNIKYFDIENGKIISEREIV